jgi:hypothetical protein
LLKLALVHAPGWPTGVYFFGDDILRVGIVVASELPRDRSSLLVRLMVAGPLLVQAIDDLSALPADAYERDVAEQILLRLRRSLSKKSKPTLEEQEFIVTMQDTWASARALGRAEEAVRAVLTVLRARGIDLPKAAHDRILAQKDPERLERWLEKAAVAASVAEVLDEPS